MSYQYTQQKQMLHEIKQDEELFISQYLSQEKLEEDTADLLYGVNNDRKEYEEKIKVSKGGMCKRGVMCDYEECHVMSCDVM